MPEVSVIIPTYNRAKWVIDAVASVIAQDFADYEILVVDDGSTDDTCERLAVYGNKVRTIRMEHSGLPARARNRGIQASQGPYLAFLDSDDRWHPTKLSRQLELIHDHPEAGLCCTNGEIQKNGQNGAKVTFFPSQPDFVGDALSTLISNNFIITSSVVMRRDLLENLGGFYEGNALCALEDYDLWLQAATRTQIGYLSTPLVIYNDRPQESLRSQRKSSQNWSAMLLILDRLEKILTGEKREFPPEVLQVLRLRRAASYMALIRSLWQDKQFGRALFACGSALLSQPRFNLELLRRKFLGQNIQYSEFQKHEYFTQRRILQPQRWRRSRGRAPDIRTSGPTRSQSQCGYAQTKRPPQ
jgi:glycosyltransferase involved in cell wall biosynthesis